MPEPVKIETPTILTKPSAGKVRTSAAALRCVAAGETQLADEHRKQLYAALGAEKVDAALGMKGAK